MLTRKSLNSKVRSLERIIGSPTENQDEALGRLITDISATVAGPLPDWVVDDPPVTTEAYRGFKRYGESDIAQALKMCKLYRVGGSFRDKVEHSVY